LRRLARRGQILAVTHLPQVASQGDVQFRVSKSVEQGRTHATVTRLDAEERVAEVARMLAGEQVTALSLSHARELLEAPSEGLGAMPSAGTTAPPSAPSKPRAVKRSRG